jgi:DNA polymerase III delta prime subunit
MERKRKTQILIFVAASLLYFAASAAWLIFKLRLSFADTVVAAVTAYVVLTFAVGVGLYLWRSDVAKNVASLTDERESAEAPSPQRTSSPLNASTDQETLRRIARIEALRKDARKIHDRVLRDGAIISIGLILFSFLMRLAFGLSPKDTYLLPWYVVALLWFLQLALLPRSMTYASFLALAGLRFAFQTFGPTILILLPNFLMLPFFYLAMMFFMYGSIMIPNLMQIKYYKPGDATWETPEGSMRGQPEVRAIVETHIRKFIAWAEGRGLQKATRGMIFEGPPGTGKTLYAKELATRLQLPFVFADGQAFNAPFFGFAPLLVLWMRYRTEALAKEYGGSIVFIDEAEQLLQVRAGMPAPQQDSGAHELWNILPFDRFGHIGSCGIAFDTRGARDRFWELKVPKRSEDYVHPIIFGGFGGFGGASAAIFPFLTWLNGADGPPFWEKLLIRKVNELLHACFLPVVFRKRILRLPPGKARNYNLLFIAATNRAWMIDPAMRRPGRFGVSVPFKTPGLYDRADIIDLYVKKAVAKGFLHPILATDEKIHEFARATSGMSPAEIEAVIEAATDVRSYHVENLKRIKEELDRGTPLEALPEQDRKYWLRYRDVVGQEGWDDLRADWDALMEARSQTLWGRSDPSKTSEAHRHRTAYHEFMGHFIELKAFLGKYMRPTVLSIMPRGPALGMVAHQHIEERDPMPQSFYEGLLRVMVGSTVAERFFFGENQPGVSSDLENATRVACLMVGKFAMVPYACSEEERSRYEKIGETLISVPDVSPLMPSVQSLIQGVLAHPETRRRVAVFLGQAFVDDYRLIRANASIAAPVVAELERLDEFSGKRLEDLWEELNTLVTLDMLSETERTRWPARTFEAANPFYGPQTPEAEEVLR